MSSLAVAEQQNNQSIVDSLSNICDTSYGAFTLQKTVCKTSKFICTFETLPKRALMVASKTATLFGVCLTGFVIRDVAESFKSLVTSLCSCASNKKPEDMSDEEWNKKRKDNLFDATYSIFDFIYNLGDLVDLANTVSLISLSSFSQTVFGYVANAASLVSDSLDLFKNIMILNANWNARSAETVARRKLAIVHIVSDVVSIALTIIAISNIYVGASLCAARAIMTARKLHSLDLVYLSMVWAGLIYEERYVKQYDAPKQYKPVNDNTPKVSMDANLAIA